MIKLTKKRDFQKQQRKLLHAFVTLIFFINIAFSQDPWSFPPSALNQFVDILAINNPGVGTAITTVPRTYGITYAYIPKIIIGIAGIQFTPQSILNYKLQSSSTLTVLTIKLTLTYPTSFASIRVCYFAQIRTDPVNSIIQLYFNTQIQSLTPSSSQWSLINGNKKISYALSTPTGTLSRSNLKCFSQILGLTGTSISQYKYSLQCYFKSTDDNSVKFNHDITLYGDTTATVITLEVIYFDSYLTSVIKKTQLSIQKYEYNLGTTSDTFSMIDPTRTISFLGINYLTMKIGQLFKFQFDLGSSFSTVPLTSNNIFSQAFLSTRSCSNPSNYLDRFNFQCSVQSFASFYPNFVDIDTLLTDQINSIVMSKSKRFIAICLDGSVIIYRFNGVSYVIFQTLFMSTNCKGLDSNDDFSILAIVGTNLFQVYAIDSSGKFSNFYTFPSQLGITYANTKISLTPNGMKAVILSSVTSGSTTGHYHFVYNRTINEYVYMKFQASDANDVYFSKDGLLLNALTKKRIITYKEKEQSMMGNFIIYNVFESTFLYPSIFSGYSSINGNFIANYLQFTGITIYHFDNATKTYLYHSFIEDVFGGKWTTFVLKISDDGLLLILVGTSSTSIIYLYTRPNLSSQFVFKCNSDYDPTFSSGYLPAITLSSDNQQIVTKQNSPSSASPTSIFRIYSTSLNTVNMIDPPNGIDLIYYSAKKYEEFISALKNQSSTSSLISSLQNDIKQLKQDQLIIKSLAIALVVVLIIIVIAIIFIVKKYAAFVNNSNLTEVKPQQKSVHTKQKDMNNTESNLGSFIFQENILLSNNVNSNLNQSDTNLNKSIQAKNDNKCQLPNTKNQIKNSQNKKRKTRQNRNELNQRSTVSEVEDVIMLNFEPIGTQNKPN